MSHLPITPLEPWHAQKLGLSPSQRPTAEHLSPYQLKRLNATLADAAEKSPFYRKQWSGGGIPRLLSLNELRRLPFTTPEDLRRAGLDFMAVSQSRVARVVTLHTSGTTGDPKRIFFSDADLERTIDFFRHGLAAMASPGQRLLILLPGQVPHSAANLLKEAAARMAVDAVVHGLVADPAETIATICEEKINSLAGIPVQVLSLARHPESRRIPAGQLTSVLLSTDYVPRAIVAALKSQWGCDVFQHYGMTEMGFGAAMSCAAHQGYHLREADLLFEIIHPVTGEPLPDGRMGEIVFTTLNHRAMPLIRYRTGDMAAILTDPCPCGSVLRRMAWVQGRNQEKIRLSDGIVLDLKSLDEALFAVAGVINFQVALKCRNATDYLSVTLHSHRHGSDICRHAADALSRIPAIRAAQANQTLALDAVEIDRGMGPSDAVVKRTIRDQREVE